METLRTMRTSLKTLFHRIIRRDAALNSTDSEHLKQKDLAKKLKISDAKLSLIMNGKQKPDIDFLKAVYFELKVDAEFILEHA